jgi:methylation protein EvaC
MNKRKSNCRICGSNNLMKFISFGKMPVSNAFLKKEDLNKPEYYYDMDVGFCKDCYMVQLIEIVPYHKYIVPDKEGNTNYAFFTSTSKFMEKHFAGLAKEVEDKFLSKNSRVLEIGSNDGTMLKAFKNRDKVVGIEPSHNVAKIARIQGIESITQFFGESLAKKVVTERGKFRVVLSTNVTLNIIDLHDFMKGVNTLLDNKGVFITEDPYILSILEQNSYDQIYDEHNWYFSLSSLSNLLRIHGMEIFDGEKQWVHGGSMRIFACKEGVYKPTVRLQKYLRFEKERKITSIKSYLGFAESVRKNRESLIGLLRELKAQRKKIIGYAAASKGTVVQNYCDIGADILDYISDSTPFKQGLYSPGKHIPIVSMEHFHEDKDADYALLFAWNHAREIMQKEQDFFKRGGRFIVHLPHPRILHNYQLNEHPF